MSLAHLRNVFQKRRMRSIQLLYNHSIFSGSSRLPKPLGYLSVFSHQSALWFRVLLPSKKQIDSVISPSNAPAAVSSGKEMKEQIGLEPFTVSRVSQKEAGHAHCPSSCPPCHSSEE
jgi:hypothetical protein